MREIKFRGKRVDNGEWVFGSFVPVALEGSNGDLISCGFIRRHNRGIGKMEAIEVDRETVGQYTGLKDKNGVEIYEGSLVKSITYGYVGEVKYVPENAAFLVFWSDDKGRHTDYLDEGMCQRLEVIGNIHDKAGDE